MTKEEAISLVDLDYMMNIRGSHARQIYAKKVKYYVWIGLCTRWNVHVLVLSQCKIHMVLWKKSAEKRLLLYSAPSVHEFMSKHQENWSREAVLECKACCTRLDWS